MKKIDFTKMIASGNDFVIINRQPIATNYQVLAKKICVRKYGIGADGLLVLEVSRKADIKMRIFNADGTEAEMCGNGARCAAFYTACKSANVTIETKAGIIESEISGNNVKIKLTDPKDMKLDIPIKVNNRNIRINFISTGVPHAIVFVDGLDKINVKDLGMRIRYHKAFAPRGTNVDFVEVINKNSIRVRTYERGVEDETLACGTGSVASALLSVIRYPLFGNKVNISTRGGEILKVYFDKSKNLFKNVWLEGEVKIVYKGVYNV